MEIRKGLFDEKRLPGVTNGTWNLRVKITDPEQVIPSYIHRRDEGELWSLNFEGRIFCCWKCGSGSHIGDKCRNSTKTFDEAFNGSASDEDFIKPTWAAVVQNSQEDNVRLREMEAKIKDMNKRKEKEKAEALNRKKEEEESRTRALQGVIVDAVQNASKHVAAGIDSEKISGNEILNIVEEIERSEGKQSAICGDSEESIQRQEEVDESNTCLLYTSDAADE